MAKNLDSLVGVMLNKTNEKTGLRLSDVFYVNPSELRPNPFNKVLFKKESEEYFERMTDDIRTRGILVPLIAKNDGTLLAGHNRLEIAQRLKLTKIPVQYLEDKLSEENEKEFIVKDNIFRRQHSAEEWLTLYKTLYPNFEQRLAAHGRPTVNNNQSDKADKSALLANGTQSTSSASANEALTVKKIARDTGQSTAAVQKQLHRAGLRNSSDGATKGTTKQAGKNNKKLNPNVNQKAVGKHGQSAEAFFEKMLNTIKKEHPATKKELLSVIKRVVSEFQQKLQDS